MKEGLNGKSTKVTANPSPFIQHKVNFVENILYDELASDEEYPIVRILGAPILRIPGGSYPRRRRNLEGRQNFTYEGMQDLNVDYKRIPDHHLT
nr:hypothetical protein CFP56_05993 [Quercus suber]